MTNEVVAQCITLPDGSVVIHETLFDKFSDFARLEKDYQEHIEQLRGNLSLAEEGLANATQEIEALKHDNERLMEATNAEANEVQKLREFIEQRCIGSGAGSDAERWRMIKEWEKAKAAMSGEQHEPLPSRSVQRRVAAQKGEPAPEFNCHFRAFGTMPCQLPRGHDGPHSCGNSVEAEWETAKDAMSGQKSGVCTDCAGIADVSGKIQHKPGCSIEYLRLQAKLGR